MSRKVEESTSNPPAPSSAPETLWAQHRRAIVILLIGALALTLLTAAAIFLTNSTEPELNPELEGIVAGADASLEESKHQIIDVAIWIGWCVGVFLIGYSVRSELRQRPTDQDAGAVEGGDQ